MKTHTNVKAGTSLTQPRIVVPLRPTFTDGGGALAIDTGVRRF